MNLEKVQALRANRAVPALRAVGSRLERVRKPLRNSVLRDVVVALIVATLALGHDYSDGIPSATSSVFDVAFAVPLLWRRRRPLEAFLAISAIAVVQWFTDSRVASAGAGAVAILVALYSVGAYESRRGSLPAAVGLAQVGVVVAVLRWNPPDGLLLSLFQVTGTVTASWVIGRYVGTRRAYISSVLERAATAERERDQRALRAVGDERARISREMHDIVAHSLSVMVALSDGAAMSVTRAPGDAQEAMEQTSKVGRQALGEVRRLLGVRRDPDHLDLAPMPGVAELDDLIGQVRSTGLPVDLVIVGEPLALPPSAQLSIYRVVQESLTNVLRHAQAATWATVTLRYLPSGVEVDVDNDDRAGDVGEPGRPGRGLAGMRERAASFGGTLEASRRPDGGWHVGTYLKIERQDVPG